MRSARGNFVGQALPPAAKKQQAGMLALQRQVEAMSRQRPVASPTSAYKPPLQLGVEREAFSALMSTRLSMHRDSGNAIRLGSSVGRAED
jgi:hypothetical protein